MVVAIHFVHLWALSQTSRQKEWLPPNFIARLLSKKYPMNMRLDVGHTH